MNALGINMWNWVIGLEQDCTGLPSKVSKLGFSAIELPMTIPDIPEYLIEEIERLPLEVSICAALSQGRDISNFDPAIRKATTEYFARCLESASRVGAKTFAGPLYAGGGKRHLLTEDDKKREWDLAVHGVRELAEKAQQANVTLSIEPLNRYRTSVINTIDQVLQFILDVDMANIGVHYDTFHAGIEESSILNSLEKVLRANRLYHFHACANNRNGPGEGFFPWHDIFALLKSYNYSGHITMETFALGGLDSGWIQHDSNPDEVARKGLDFMKQQIEN